MAGRASDPVDEKTRDPDAEAGSPAPDAEEVGPEDGAGLRVQACWLSPDHHLSRRRALNLQYAQ